MIIGLFICLYVLGLGGFLWFRGMQEKKICLGVISSMVFAAFAYFFLGAMSYDSHIGMIAYILAFALCALPAGLVGFFKFFKLDLDGRSGVIPLIVLLVMITIIVLGVVYLDG